MTGNAWINQTFLESSAVNLITENTTTNQIENYQNAKITQGGNHGCKHGTWNYTAKKQQKQRKTRQIARAGWKLKHKYKFTHKTTKLMHTSAGVVTLRNKKSAETTIYEMTVWLQSQLMGVATSASSDRFAVNHDYCNLPWPAQISMGVVNKHIVYNQGQTIS